MYGDQEMLRARAARGEHGLNDGSLRRGVVRGDDHVPVRFEKPPDAGFHLIEAHGLSIQIRPCSMRSTASVKG
jgi:hypothetical protein